jgi:hypothetical protein
MHVWKPPLRFTDGHQTLIINSRFDPDGDLEIGVESGEEGHSLYLTKDQVLRIRNHLTSVLGGIDEEGQGRTP